jgi:hypothetical protein
MAQYGDFRTLVDTMDNLADLLAKRKPEEPPEIQAIKQYIKQHFDEQVQVMVRERDIVISVRSSALAGALRMHSVNMASLINTEKKFVFRISSSR